LSQARLYWALAVRLNLIQVASAQIASPKPLDKALGPGYGYPEAVLLLQDGRVVAVDARE
jgi:hypothetical protein